MERSRVGLRALKANLSGLVARVRAGEELVVTDRGVPVARLVPIGVADPLESLIAAGLAERSPAGRRRSGPTSGSPIAWTRSVDGRLRCRHAAMIADFNTSALVKLVIQETRLQPAGVRRRPPGGSRDPRRRACGSRLCRRCAVRCRGGVGPGGGTRHALTGPVALDDRPRRLLPHRVPPCAGPRRPTTSPACSRRSPGSRSTRRTTAGCSPRPASGSATSAPTTTCARRVPRTAKAELVANQRAHPPFGEFLAVPRAEFASLHTSPGPIYIPRLAVRAGRHAGPEGGDRGDGRAARRRRARHALVPHHAGRAPAAPRLRGGRLPRHQRRHRAEPAPGRGRAATWGATVYAGTPSFLANLGDTAREMGLDPRRDLHYRVGFSTAEALTPALRARAQRHLRHRAVRPLRRGADRPAGRRVPRARGHAPPRARSLLRVPRSGDRRAGRRRAGPASWSRRSSGRARCRSCATRRATSSACCAGACACGDPSPRVVFVGQKGAIRKIKGVLVHPAQVHRALSRAFPERRALPDRRRASGRASATTARCCASALTEPAADPRRASRAPSPSA